MSAGRHGAGPSADHDAALQRGARARHGVGRVGVQLQQRLPRRDLVARTRPADAPRPPACTACSLRARPAPSRQAATPTASASQRPTHAGALREHVLDVRAQRAAAPSGSPPCAAIIRSHTVGTPRPTPAPAPGRRRHPGQRQHLPRPAPRSARRRRPGRRRAAPRPTRPPPARCRRPGPSGTDMSVSSADGRAARASAPIRTIASASSRAGSRGLHERAGPDLHVEHQRLRCPRRSSCS